jgi:hypothetical protein
MNRSSLRVAGMVAAAVAITAIATAAVTAAVTGDDSTLTPGQVEDLLAGATTTTPSSTPSATGTATPGVVTGQGDQVATLAPGIVAVRCDGDRATLVSWSPSPGYRADDPVRGPAAVVEIRFEHDGSDADYKVTATCSDGVATVALGPDDHSGGGRGGGD